MTSPEEFLRRWREAGLIDDEIVRRITAFEAARQAPGGATAAAVPAREDRPGMIEALLYLGVAVAIVGAFTLVAQHWDELRSWARIAVIGVPTVLALLAGEAMRRSDEPGIQRAGQVAWLGAVALFAGTILVALDEFSSGDSDHRAGILVAALATSVGALLLWVVSPRHPQVLAVGGSLLFVALAAANWPDEYDIRIGGMLAMLFGLAGIALTEAGSATPRDTARGVFGLLAAIGPYLAGLDGSVIWAELLVFVIGAGLAALSVVRASFTYMVIGVAISFIGLVTFIFEHFGNRLGAPLALMISGALVIAGVLILAQARGAVRQRRLA
jgi:hypothetical protein